MVTVKSVLCLLKIYINYKLPGFRIKFLKLKFWKLLSNSSATFNLEPEFLDSGRKSWTLDSERWTLDTGRWTQDAGFWTLDSGRWTADAER